MGAAPPSAAGPDINESSSHYKTDQILLKTFLLEFTEGMSDDNLYLIQLREVKDRVRVILDIKLDDLIAFKRSEYEPVVARIEANASRYLTIFSQAIDSCLSDEDVLETNPDIIGDTFDILHRQRIAQNENIRRAAEENAQNNPEDAEAQMNNGGVANDAATLIDKVDYPVSLTRRYELRIIPRTEKSAPPTPPPPVSLRHIRSSAIGRLVTTLGMVSSERPNRTEPNRDPHYSPY